MARSYNLSVEGREAISESTRRRFSKPIDQHIDGGYGRRHKEVRKARGKASSHICADRCGKQAREWAHIHDTDPSDVMNYKPLCVSCHHKYDDRPAKSSATQKGRPRPDISISNLGNRRAAGKRTPEQCESIREGRWGKRRKPEAAE